MDINAVRRQNLRLLIDEEFQGSLAEFARFVGKDPNYISRYFSQGNQMRNIGTATARHVEQRLKRPHGWLDRMHGTVQEAEGASYKILPAEAQQIAETWLDLPKTYREVVRDLLEVLHKTVRKK